MIVLKHVIHAYSYEITGCEVVWTIRDDSISSTFFDVGAATFFLPHLEEQSVSLSGVGGEQVAKKPLKRSKYTLDSFGNNKTDGGNFKVVFTLQMIKKTVPVFLLANIKAML